MTAIMRSGANPSTSGRWLVFWCPGCADLHELVVESPGSWSWNGDPARPTITPSLQIKGVQWAQGELFYNPNHWKVHNGQPTVCHSYIVDGCWQYLSDCTHDLAGQTVPIPPLPEHLQ